MTIRRVANYGQMQKALDEAEDGDQIIVMKSFRCPSPEESEIDIDPLAQLPNPPHNEDTASET
jgi:hypothetical protein